MPCTSVDRTVCPSHFTKSLSLIVNITASVGVATFPLKEAPAVFLIHIVITFVIVGSATFYLRLLLPFTIAMLEPILESSLISVSIHPFVLSVSFRLPIWVLSNIHVTVGEEIRSVPVSEAWLPLSFISISIKPDMHAISISFATLPLTDVRLPIGAFPNSISLFGTKYPLSIVDLTILPLIQSFPVCLAL